MAKPKLSAEDQFLEKWHELGYPDSDITRQYRFHPSRRWVFDFAFPSRRVAIEVDGRAKKGQFGGHQSVIGVRRDCEKANNAIKLGWYVLRLPTSDITTKAEDGTPLIETFIELVCEVLTQRTSNGESQTKVT